MSHFVRASCLLTVFLAAGCSKSKDSAPKSDPSTAAGSAAIADPVAAGSAVVDPVDPAAGSAAAADPSAAGSAADPAGTDTPPADPATLGDNYLSLVSGAYLVAQPEQDNHFDLSPINLIIDGSTWQSQAGKTGDFVFVIETPGVTTLSSVAFNTSHIFHTSTENANHILFEASNTSATDGFQPLLDTSLDQAEDLYSFPLTTKVPARWFRLTVKDNHGGALTNLKRIYGYGTQDVASIPTELTGAYRPIEKATGKPETRKTNEIYIKQDGTIITGCWRERSGTLNGGLSGTVAPIEWTHPDLGKNTGLIIATGAGHAMMWRLNNGGFWALDKLERVSTDLGACGNGSKLTDTDGADSALAKQLSESGRAVVYGINFDFNSDRLRAESKTVLDQIAAVMAANPDWKLRIEGHTDSIGGADYNQKLSEKRAAAVVAFLTDAKVAADRLSSSGAGQTAPIASNDTDLGRARNRRVELVKQ